MTNTKRNKLETVGEEALRTSAGETASLLPPDLFATYSRAHQSKYMRTERKFFRCTTYRWCHEKAKQAKNNGGALSRRHAWVRARICTRLMVRKESTTNGNRAMFSITATTVTIPARTAAGEKDLSCPPVSLTALSVCLSVFLSSLTLVRTSEARSPRRHRTAMSRSSCSCCRFRRDNLPGAWP